MSDLILRWHPLRSRGTGLREAKEAREREKKQKQKAAQRDGKGTPYIVQCGQGSIHPYKATEL